MQNAGPPPHPQAIEDAEHLKLLSIFHYVMAGLTALGGCFPLIHVVLGIMFVTGGIPTGTTPPGSAPPATFGWFFIVIGGGISLMLWIFAALLFVAARRLSERRSRTYCFVIACLSCAGFPLGTALGVFTILVLQRPSVRQLFDPPLSGGYLNR